MTAAVTASDLIAGAVLTATVNGLAAGAYDDPSSETIHIRHATGAQRLLKVCRYPRQIVSGGSEVGEG